MGPVLCMSGAALKALVIATKLLRYILLNSLVAGSVPGTDSRNVLKRCFDRTEHSYTESID